MGSPPPGLGIGGESAVHRPGVSLIEPVQHKVPTDLFRVTNALKAAHVLAGGEDIGILYFGVHLHDLGDDIFLVGKGLFFSPFMRKEEVAPYQRRIDHL